MKNISKCSAEIAQRVVKVSNVLHAAGIRQYLIWNYFLILGSSKGKPEEAWNRRKDTASQRGQNDCRTREEGKESQTESISGHYNWFVFLLGENKTPPLHPTCRQHYCAAVKPESAVCTFDVYFVSKRFPFYRTYSHIYIAPDSRGYPHNIFLVSPRKHIMGTH